MKKQSVLKVLSLFGAMLFVVFTYSFTSPKDYSLKANDKNIAVDDYPSIKIGSQEWMTENLNVDHFRNGDQIPEAKSKSEWVKAGENSEPAWCYYDNDPANGGIYGKLYNWFAVIDPRGLAPDGWHIPTDKEWTVLTEYLGGKEIESRDEDGIPLWYTPSAGGKMKSIGTQYWKSPNKNATNSSGFSGLPGGTCSNNGHFLSIGDYGYWWSSFEDGTSEYWYRFLYYYAGFVVRNHIAKNGGLSVRCLRD